MSEKDEFIRHFREIQPKMSRFYARILNEANLNLSQYALLNLLSSAGSIPMTEVSEKLHISKPAVTNLVDRLEEGRLLKRLPHPHDRRVSLLQIQSKGEKVVRTVQAAALDFLLKAFERLSFGERKVVTEFYAALSKTMDEVLRKRK